MLWKQHTGFKNRLLAMLFLFFNCVCTAAPVLKLTGENYKDAVSSRMVQIPNSLEGEEENHATSSGYINHFNHFFIRKHSDRHLNQAVSGGAVTSFFAADPPKAYRHDTGALPVPGYYAFLFRYNLF